MPVKSYVNQPDRIFISSSDDTQTPYNGFFNTFQANYVTPILNAERCQLLRATIPTPMPNLPDYQLQFVYAKKNNQNDPITSANLRCIRILPYGYEPTSGAYSINRYISSYQDFVNLLNNAAANDNGGYNPYFQSNDCSFTYDSTQNKIIFTGADATKYYEMVGYDNPLFNTVYNNIQLPPGYLVNPNSGGSFVADYTLNSRVGFAQPSILQGSTSANSMIAVTGGTPIVADSYPNLVRTQCIYLYSNLAVGSAMGSNGKHNVLCVIPVNSPQLGVTNYTALTINFLTKIAQDSFTNVTIEMRDDADQPYVLPDNAQINLEIAFKYHDHC